MQCWEVPLIRYSNSRKTYNNILKADSTKITAERDVFHRFFTKPQALLKDMKVLQNSVKGQNRAANT